MSNFSEVLTYWYLRLNGFFPITNWVFHRSIDGARIQADADLIAIRFPYVREVVGGLEEDWDTVTFQRWGISHREHIIGLMVEVKGGRLDRSTIQNIISSFSTQRLIPFIQRLGFWSSDLSEEIAESLSSSELYSRDDGFVIGKLLVTQDEAIQGNLPACLKITLNEINRFIVERMNKYPEKGFDRYRFPDELMQYIAWSGSREE